MRVDLTDKKVAGLKAGEKRFEVKDGKSPLYCVVGTNGSKTWQWRGRLGDGFARRTLGHYPDMTLASARAAAMAIKADKSAIINETPKAAPVTVTPAIVASKGEKTVSKCFALYMENEGNQRKTADERWKVFARDIEPHIGTMAITEVDHDDLAAIVEAKFEVAPISSNRLQALMARFFRWSVTKGRGLTGLKVNPMADVVKMATENARLRPLSDQEIKWFLESLAFVNGFGPVFRFMLYTTVRRSQAFGMTWGMVTDKLIVFSESKGLPNSKADKRHVIPLTNRLRELLPARPADAKDSDRVWSVKAIGYSKPVARLREKMIELANSEGATIEPWNMHDLRSTATTIFSSILDEDENQLIPRDVQEHLMAHKDVSVRGKHYDAFEYIPQKRKALDLWAEYLDNIAKKISP